MIWRDERKLLLLSSALAGARCCRRKGTQKGIDCIEVSTCHMPINGPRHNGQIVISNHIVTSAYRDLELF